MLRTVDAVVGHGKLMQQMKYCCIKTCSLPFDIRCRPAVPAAKDIFANGDLDRINGVLNAEKYRQISIMQYHHDQMHFAAGQPHTHTANVIKNYLPNSEEKGVLEVMVLASREP